MSDFLDSQIERIERRLQADDQAALSDASKLSDLYPDDPRVWCLLAYAQIRHADAQSAVESMTVAIRLSPAEPGMLFDRGRYELKQSHYELALADFNRALAICEQQHNEHYREGIHFLRACALLELGRKAEARADLSLVRDDFALWTTELISKADLLAQCAS